MACLELEIGGMAGISPLRASCGRRLLFPEETIKNKKEEEEVVGVENFRIKGILVK